MAGDRPSAPTTRPPRLLDQLRAAIRARHYSPRTERAYVSWCLRYILFHRKRHPREMGAREVNRFVTHLATVGRVSSSTQRQALSAILFLYRKVLGIELELDQIPRAKIPKSLPVVLTRGEVRTIFRQFTGRKLLMVTLLYGAGLRLLECLRLRVKDIDFERHQIVVRSGKGRQDRATVLPQGVERPLREHLQQMKKQHDADLARGAGWVELPFALARKLPNAGREWA